MDRNSHAGDFLKQYENARYTIWEKIQKYFPKQKSIIIPPQAETFADVSFWQAVMNWLYYSVTAKLRGAIIRIGQGNWKDSEFEYNYKTAKQNNVILGGYWFYDDRYSPDEQARTCIAAMVGKVMEMEIFVDWETSFGGMWGGLPNVTIFAQKLEAAGIKCYKIGCYTGYYWWREHTDPVINASQYTYWKQRPLWLAWYASPDVVKIPAPWTNWTHWQWGTPAVYVGQPSAEIDMNKTNGTLDKYGAVIQPPPGGSTMTNGTAQEILGKTGTIRTSPEAVSGNDTGKRVAPYSTIEFTEVVNGASVPADKWLKLPDGNYVNYIIAGRAYFKILTQPSTPPPPAGGGMDVTVTVSIEGQQPLTLTGTTTPL